MAGNQAPKGFGILFVLVGIPLIIWSAADANSELQALKAGSSPSGVRVESCVAKTEGLISIPGLHRDVCECVVENATEQDALGDYGGYDKAALGPIIDQCLQGDRG
jgi:hypothetical protein